MLSSSAQEGDDPWIVAKDVYDVLELINITEVFPRIDDEENYLNRVELGLNPGNSLLLGVYAFIL